MPVNSTERHISAHDLHVASMRFTCTYIALAAITFIAILARVYVRVYLRYDLARWSSWRWSDRLLITTWFGFTSCAIMNFALLLSNDSNPHLSYAYNVTFWIWVFVVKGAWLCFYDEFISKSHHYKSWLAVRIAGFLLVFGGVTTFIYSNIWCLPLTRNWSNGPDRCELDIVGKTRWVYYRQIWHAGTDVLILCIPLALLPSLPRAVPLRSRIAAAIMFLVGLFCTVTSCVYLAYYSAESRVRCFLEYEPVVELAAAMLIQCAPAVRVMVVQERRRSVARGTTTPNRISLQNLPPMPAFTVIANEDGNVPEEDKASNSDASMVPFPGRVWRPPRPWLPPSSWDVPYRARSMSHENMRISSI